MSDGWDLDQYLFASSSPLDFYIDLQGFNPHPSEPAKVTMRVYDVDQVGAPGFPQCQVEVDKVYANGAYLGNLTGANNQWSIVTFSIPAGSLNAGSNHFRVDIDVLTGWCWAVQVDWAEVEIPFNIAQVEASAFSDVTIKRGKTDVVITDPIWKTDFDTDGKVISPANPDDPIADKIKGSWFFNWGARKFEYRYKLDNWPSGAQPTWQPKVKYSWAIQGTGQSGNGEETGWEDDFKVTLPKKVGKYTLRVTLKIYHENTLLRTENRTHTLYVLYSSPVGTTTVTGGSSIATGQPRAAWLDVATSWANGQSTEVGILGALNSSEYGGGSNPLGWGYGYPKFDPVTLIENGAGKNGDCFVFRDVWRILAATLGISTSSTEYRPSGGFMTSTRQALDGNASANARNKATGDRDRWRFGNHQYGLRGGTFYDPTYGLTGPNTIAGKESNVFCKVDGTEGGRMRCTVLNPPPIKALIASTGRPINGWTLMEYETFDTISSSSSTRSAPIALEPAGIGGFTGTTSDAGYDGDGNGLFELLQVDVEVDVTEAGDFGFLAALTTASGDLIAVGSLDPGLNHDTPLTHAPLETGLQTVAIYFPGLGIRSFGVDGPYTVSLALFDDEGAQLDTIEFATGVYSYVDFQGLLLEVQSLSDSGVDTDALPGYNVLRVSAQVNMLAAGEVMIQGQLFAGGTFLADAMEMTSLSAGLHTLDLDFPGEAIAASGLNGPYTVYLSFGDGYYMGSQEHTTGAYNSGDFQLPNAFFTGNISDSGNDANGNGLYDELRIQVEAAALAPDTYTVYGILQDGADGFIGTAEATVALGTTPIEVTLSFSGPDIHRHGADGPYQVILALTDADDEDLVGLAYMTSAYAFADFERPGALFDGSFVDNGVDTDGDGFYNVLRIGVGVVVADAGTYFVDGSLHDNAGNFIVGAQTEVFLAAGTHTVNLDFDGRAINGHGVNGPYRLLALELAQNTAGTMDDILEAYSTSPYAYNEFQPIGLLLTGNLADYGEDTNGNGLYDALVVEMEVVIAQSAVYAFNARLVDTTGEEIVWAAHIQYLASGTHWISLRFDGRYIYGHGVDGPYDVKDLSIYSGSQSFTLLDVHTTAVYPWQAFELSGVVSGTVTVAGQSVPNANIYISGVDTDLTDSGGTYRLTVLSSGMYVINIDADPSLSPWQIWVNGTLVAEGTSATIQVVVGQVTEVDFVSSVAMNAPPIADAGGPYEGTEGETITLDASGSEDPDDNIVLYEWDLDNDGEYDDVTGLTPEVVFYENGTYYVGLRVIDEYGESDTDTAAITVYNVPPEANADPSSQTVQYSDSIASIIIVATDVAADPLTASTSWSVDGGGFTPGLPSNLVLAAESCTTSDTTNTCTWTLSGTANVPVGIYVVRVTVEDDDLGQSNANTTLIVLPESATVGFDADNPVAVQVAEPGGNSGPFSLTMYVSETQPDQPVDSSAPGDISLANVSASLVPVGPGSPASGACTSGTVIGSGYDAVLPVTCSFDGVEVNAYTAQVTVGGNYYTGAAEDVLTVYDPSLGFATGGGWFYWPGTDERTNFGFTMKYNKKGTNVKGNLLLIRHLADGSIYRVKSNALYGLALGEGEADGELYGWASFSGKVTYLEPGWPEPIGNHEFVVYIEDRDEPGTGADRFWIELKDQSRNIVAAMSMDREATDNAVELQGGNIAVPHGGGAR